MTTPIIALHGFLGRPQDFNILLLPHLRSIDIFRTLPSPLVSWAHRFNRGIDKKTLLMGYSMGGRAALHCLIDNPALYEAAIIIAAHAGLRNEEQKKERYRWDIGWSKKFARDDWQKLMQEWDQSPALRDSRPMLRRENEFDRTSLSQFMRYFSLSTQAHLIPAINQLPMPILWLAAKKEMTNSEGLQLKHPLSKKILIEGSHRFIFEDSCTMNKIIVNFLECLKERNKLKALRL